jgi:hypothetical protein
MGDTGATGAASTVAGPTGLTGVTGAIGPAGVGGIVRLPGRGVCGWANQREQDPSALVTTLRFPLRPQAASRRTEERAAAARN